MFANVLFTVSNGYRIMKKPSGLVYSTELGKLCFQCHRSVNECVCKNQSLVKGDGVIRIHRETKGRGGKAVTIIRGLPVSQDELKKLAKKLKQACGVGGSVKDSAIEIQGDCREKIQALLKKEGYESKLSGG